MNIIELSAWLVWGIPIVGSLFIPVFGRLGEKIRNLYVLVIQLLILLLTLSLVPPFLVSPATVIHYNAPWIPSLGINAGVLVDPLSLLFTTLVAIIGLVVAIYSFAYMKGEKGLDRYYFFLVFFIGSMIGLLLADNFLQLFIFWEIVGLCSFALVAFWYQNPQAVKGGIKVFMMTKIGDIALLGAIVLLYASQGTFSYTEIFSNAGNIALPILSISSFLVLVGTMAKSVQMPLHTWLYNAMEAPTSISCLLHGATMVKAGVYLLARLHVMFYVVPGWLSAMGWIGGITALLGATLALNTNDIKGVPAYSTISQIGFMYAAMSTATSPYGIGWFASLFHTISHAFFQGLGFLAIGSIVHQMKTRDMRKLGGLRTELSAVFILCVIVILARAGVPPFCSFFSKQLIATSIAESGNLLLLLMIYGSASLTFAYSLRFLIMTFFGEKSDYAKQHPVHPAPRLEIFAASILAAGSIVLGFFEGSLANFMNIEGIVTGLGQIINMESLVFSAILAVGGIPTVLYVKKKQSLSGVYMKGPIPLYNKVLTKGYYIDTFYERYLCKTVIKAAERFYDKVEISGLQVLPVKMAEGVVSFSKFIRNTVETALNTLVNMSAKLTIRSAQLTRKGFYDGLHTVIVKIQKLKNGELKSGQSSRKPGLSHYILASLIGFIFLSVLLILSL
ncbi:MAG: NADH-quinone oxidoreductase subunit 5 family protein [Candidatus Ranarchaeia archaeon]